MGIDVLNKCSSYALRFCVSPPIGQALSADALKQLFRAHGVVEPELLAIIVAEVKLGSVTV